MSPAARPVLPLPGPLQQDPTSEVYRLGQLAPADRDDSAPMTAAHGIAERMLGQALAGVELGDWDGQIVAWLARKDVSVLATVASLLRRATMAGVDAGRREAAEDAAPDMAAALEAARSAVNGRVAAEREATERRMGVEAGSLAPIEDPRYGAVLEAWSAWMQATNALSDALGGGS